MFSAWQLVLVAVLYMLILFGVAYYADKRAERGRGLVNHPAIYTLSIAVYCTSWTFYGSVGRATQSGLGFLPIYLGPTLVFGFGWLLIRKIVVIAKAQRTTSIADFIGARYGKSQGVAGLVAAIAIVGTIPYIALQLKAVSTSLEVLAGDPTVISGGGSGDASLIVAVALAVFAMLFGARHIDATEQHEGVVVAVAFESVVKLAAFLAVGVFVTFVLHGGFGELFARAAERPEIARLLSFEAASPNWVVLTALSAAAIVCLPRQFQVTVVGNVDLNHLRTAIWLFPLYLLVINIFVLPIALAGLLRFPDGSVNADAFVLALPMIEDAGALALAVFIGGLSAATAMVIVATIAVSIMASNDLVMPFLLRFGPRQLRQTSDLTQLLLGVRRAAMLLTVTLGYFYFRVVDASYALVSIGLVSFAAAAQFAPVLFGALFWRGGTRVGAMAGLSAGFLVWGYTLFLPSILPGDFVRDGLFGVEALRPYALFGLQNLDPISHALFWSMLANIVAFVTVSLCGNPSMIERTQATLFVEALNPESTPAPAVDSGSGPEMQTLSNLGERFVGRDATSRALEDYASLRNLNLSAMEFADGEMVRIVERLIAGAVGAASARVAVASMLQREDAKTEDILRMLDETSQVLEYSRRLEEKSQALEIATEELSQANERLKELDVLKDEFLSTVTHELRTPLTSIRALTELMFDEPDMECAQRQEYLGVVIRESERLTRLINQVLDAAKIEAGQMDWQVELFDLGSVVRDAAESMSGIYEAEGVRLDVSLPKSAARVNGDRDRVSQVVLNLLSNALKFSPKQTGVVRISLASNRGMHSVSVSDNGPGVPADQRESVFDRFHQSSSDISGNPTGTGLGLAISRMIVEYLGGRIWVDRSDAAGSNFVFTLPSSD